MTYFRWISSGDCDKCTAMEGLYPDLPARPHPFCKCTIVAIDPVWGLEGCYGTEPILIGPPQPTDVAINFDDPLAPGEPPNPPHADDPDHWFDAVDSLGRWPGDQVEVDDNGRVVTVMFEFRGDVLCPDNSILRIGAEFESDLLAIDTELRRQADERYPNDWQAASTLAAQLTQDDSFWSSVAGEIDAALMEVARSECPDCDDGSDPDDLPEDEDED